MSLYILVRRWFACAEVCWCCRAEQGGRLGVRRRRRAAGRGGVHVSAARDDAPVLQQGAHQVQTRHAGQGGLHRGLRWVLPCITISHTFFPLHCRSLLSCSSLFFLVHCSFCITNFRFYSLFLSVLFSPFHLSFWLSSLMGTLFYNVISFLFFLVDFSSLHFLSILTCFLSF